MLKSKKKSEGSALSNRILGLSSHARPFFLIGISLTLFLLIAITRKIATWTVSQSIITSIASAKVKRHGIVCNDTARLPSDWEYLCSSPFVDDLDEILREDEIVNMVTIGAHVGWEKNDPFCNTMDTYLELLQDDERSRIHWTFVEPAPPNFKILTENIAKYTYLCNMTGLNYGIVSDSYKGAENMTFYSMDECIDVMTGYDSRTGRTFPIWVTQLSSFDTKGISDNQKWFKRRGLDIFDYVNELSIPAKRYSELMADIMGNKDRAPHFLMIDAQGMDCNILLGMSESSPFLPKYILFEDTMCDYGAKGTLKRTEAYLESLGYNVTQLPRGRELGFKSSMNTLAYRMNKTF